MIAVADVLVRLRSGFQDIYPVMLNSPYEIEGVEGDYAGPTVVECRHPMGG
jgi:hypothetical protein